MSDGDIIEAKSQRSCPRSPCRNVKCPCETRHILQPDSSNRSTRTASAALKAPACRFRAINAKVPG
jgi:hypothetical protein